MSFCLGQIYGMQSYMQVLDIFAVSSLITALLLFVHIFLFGSFPFNAFLAALFCCLGCFVLTMCLRLQVTESAPTRGLRLRAFVDYVLAMSVLLLAVWCYIG